MILYSNHQITCLFAVCSEVYNKTTLEKACQIGCSFDEPINLKKKQQQKTQLSVHKRKGNPKLITVPIAKDTSDSNSFPSPLIPWTLRYFSSKSQFNEEDADVNSKEKQTLPSPNLQQQPLPDFVSFPRDPLGILSKLFRPSFFLPDSDSVKITRSTVTVFGGNGDNEIQVLRSDSSKPDTIERTIISPSLEWTANEFPTETLKKPISPSTEKSQLLLPRPTMHLSDVLEKNQTDKKHRDDLLAFTVWETFGNMLFIAIIFVLVGIWAAMFRHSWITSRDYTAVSTSDPDVMMKEDIDDELGYLGFQINRRLAGNDDLLTFAPLRPPTYEETQKNKPDSLLRVALDASTSTRDDRVLHQDC